MSPAAPNSPAAKKAKRQKQIIAVGSVILLALLGFELPKVLHRGAATASAVTTAPPSVVGSPPAVPVGKLPDTDRVVIQHDSNQLLSFGLFRSKDPFVQQLSTNASVLAASPTPAAPTPKPKPASPPRVGVGLTPATPTAPVTTTTPPTSSGSSSPPAGPGPAVTTPGSPGTDPGSTTPVAPATAPADALISINRVCERIALKGTFPANEDIFRLVSIAPDRKSVEIGVVGGSYDSGQATATLKLGDKLTLVNTADGTRYVIALQSKCAVVVQPAPATSTAQVTTTPVATPPPTTTTATATTTSPIVTDSFDTPVPPSN